MLAIAYQVRETARSRSAEALARFRDYWESPINRVRRRRLAMALLDGMTVETIPAAAIEDVVNFFEDLGAALKEKHLNCYATWSTFHDDAIHYWAAIGEVYARECRDDEEYSQEYVEFGWMVKKLKAFERKKARRAAVVVDAQAVRDFLEVESQLDQLITLNSGASI
jgi:hypothetical protein